MKVDGQIMFYCNRKTKLTRSKIGLKLNQFGLGEFIPKSQPWRVVFLPQHNGGKSDKQWSQLSSCHYLIIITRRQGHIDCKDKIK